MKESILRDKSFQLSVRVLKLCRIISEKYHEYDLTSQLKRSSTSIGANLNEAEYAASKADFINKLTISLKEASETQYWIELLHEAKYLEDSEYEEVSPLVKSIIKMLTASLTTLKNRQ